MNRGTPSVEEQSTPVVHFPAVSRVMTPLILDCTAAFLPIGTRRRTTDSVKIALTPHTYLPDGEMTDGWFPNVLLGFRELAARLANERSGKARPPSFASIGIGPGLDAIAAVELLGAKKLWLIDLHDDVVQVALDNVRRNCPGLSPPQVRGFVSDLCGGLISRGLGVDVLYENLPNLPVAELTADVGVTTASFYGQERLSYVPGLYARHRLGLHYLFLNQAQRVLNPGGSVVCCIGGRVAPDLVRSMFIEQGYAPEVLNFELVKQFESEQVLSGYVEAEAQTGLTFTFFAYDEARRIVRTRRAEGATVDDVLADSGLKRVAMNATEALRSEREGHPVGHVGIVWRGRSLSAPEKF